MPPRAGVYFWTRGATRIGAVVVNAEAEESDLRRDDDRELTARFAPAAGRMTHDADSFARRLYGNAAQRPVAVPLLVGALLLLIVETMIARPSRGIPDAARRAAREAA
jgi:hypothetical protein